MFLHKRKPKNLIQLSFFLILVFMLLSCNLFSAITKSVATSQPTPTNTEQSQPEPTSEPTTQPSTTPEPLINQQIEAFGFIYREEFSTTPSDWNLSPYNNDEVKVKYSVNNGVFSWEVQAITDNVVMNKPDPSINLPEDGFLITTSAKIQSTSSPTSSGIMFRFQDFNNFYFAKLNDTGEVNAYLLKDNRWEKLAGPVKSEHFKTDAFNRLTVVDRNSQYELQVNDYPVLNFSDNRLQGGSVGLIVELDAGMNATFSFDDLSVMKPDTSAARANEGENSIPETGGAYTTFEGELGGVKYTIDHPSNFIPSTTEGLDKLCLETDDHLCVSIRRPVGVWSDAEVMAKESVADFSQMVSNFKIYHEQHTTTKDGFSAYWVGSTYTENGIDFESSRLYVVIQQVGFQVTGYGEPEMMNKYAAEIKKMIESFTILYN